jgi:hypothetical protein
VHETIRALVRAERRRSDKLANFAHWAGMQSETADSRQAYGNTRAPLITI